MIVDQKSCMCKINCKKEDFCNWVPSEGQWILEEAEICEKSAE